jgi:hypothetical protein
MFHGCKLLKEPPELPATILKPACYMGMFKNCEQLVRTPKLPATELAPECYRAMFSNCITIKNPPELPAIKLQYACYRSMFYGCTSLEKAPYLPANTLVKYAYSDMFVNCKLIDYIQINCTKGLSDSLDSLKGWLYGVSVHGSISINRNMGKSQRRYLEKNCQSMWTYIYNDNELT